ncbi:hypothetical protein BJV78DRAFT_1174059 [Lactifluus subvellereus]|nr:hypothetical protein BJV78DRAFT_1174059 [Lactifluus subvellereus]
MVDPLVSVFSYDAASTPRMCIPLCSTSAGPGSDLLWGRHCPLRSPSAPTSNAIMAPISAAVLTVNAVPSEEPALD